MAMSTMATPYTPVSSSSACITTTTNTRSTTYALNPNSLMSNLVRDASLAYDILCESNSHGHNVNVRSSSGFYAAVAKPALCSLSNGHSLTTNGIISTVATSGMDTADINGLIVNRLLKISLRTATVPSCTLGTLSIHLHHSTRLIQIQGSFMMPDSTMAPIWFAENLLLPMFKERGASSSSHIQSINNAILSLQTTRGQSEQGSLPGNPMKECGGCLKNFTGNACPMPCTSCAKFFHKTSCWKTHRCGDSFSHGISSATSAPPSFSSLPPLTQRSHPKKRAAANITHFEIDSDDDDEPEAPATIGRQPTISIHPDLLSYSAASPAVLPSLSPSLMPSLPLPSTSSILLPAAQPPPKKQKRNAVPVSKEAIDNELLRREINAASAKITSLDRELKTSQETCSILSERIKFFEDQHTNQLFEKYFSPGNPTNPNSNNPAQSSDHIPPSPPPPATAPPPVAPSSPPPATEPSPPSPCPPLQSDVNTLVSSLSSPLSRQPPPNTSPHVSPAEQLGTSPAPQPSVPPPGSQCHCLSLLSEMKVKLVGMNQQLSILTNFVNVYMSSQHSRLPSDDPPPSNQSPPEPPSSDDATPETSTTTPSDSNPGLDPHQSHEQNQNTPNPEEATTPTPSDIPAQPKQRYQKRRVLLPTPSQPPCYPRPPVWLPGRAPPPQAPASWQPRQGRSKSRPRQRGNASPKEPSVADLIN